MLTNWRPMPAPEAPHTESEPGWVTMGTLLGRRALLLLLHKVCLSVLHAVVFVVAVSDRREPDVKKRIPSALMSTLSLLNR